MYSLHLISWPEGDTTANVIDSPDVGSQAFETLKGARKAAKDIWRKNINEKSYFIGIRDEDKKNPGVNIGWVELYPRTNYKPNWIM